VKQLAPYYITIYIFEKLDELGDSWNSFGFRIVCLRIVWKRKIHSDDKNLNGVIYLTQSTSPIQTLSERISLVSPSPSDRTNFSDAFCDEIHSSWSSNFTIANLFNERIKCRFKIPKFSRRNFRNFSARPRLLRNGPRMLSSAARQSNFPEDACRSWNYFSNIDCIIHKRICVWPN